MHTWEKNRVNTIRKQQTAMFCPIDEIAFLHENFDYFMTYFLVEKIRGGAQLDTKW